MAVAAAGGRLPAGRRGAPGRRSACGPSAARWHLSRGVGGPRGRRPLGVARLQARLVVGQQPRRQQHDGRRPGVAGGVDHPAVLVEGVARVADRLDARLQFLRRGRSGLGELGIALDDGEAESARLHVEDVRTGVNVGRDDAAGGDREAVELELVARSVGRLTLAQHRDRDRRGCRRGRLRPRRAVDGDGEPRGERQRGEATGHQGCHARVPFRDVVPADRRSSASPDSEPACAAHVRCRRGRCQCGRVNGAEYYRRRMEPTSSRGAVPSGEGRTEQPPRCSRGRPPTDGDERSGEPRPSTGWRCDIERVGRAVQSGRFACGFGTTRFLCCVRARADSARRPAGSRRRQALAGAGRALRR